MRTELFESYEDKYASLQRRVRKSHFASAVVSGGDLDAQFDMPAVDGVATPDENLVDDWGETIGVGYENAETLRCGDKERDRDRHRWELDPASAEDYFERAGEPRR